MAGRRSKQKSTSWVTSTFDDFKDVTSSSLTDQRAKKRPRQAAIKPHVGKKSLQEGECGRGLWVDVYAPTSLEDLAVHKKKVQEVENWLVESMAGIKGRKFLLLTGPAGTGKSATVRLLTQKARLNLLEWINPTTNPYRSSFTDEDSIWIPGDTVVQASQTSQFWEFLLRGSKYSSVCGGGGGGNLVCVEDLPNVFTRDPGALHTMLRQYNKMTNSSPVVFILTDSNQKASSARHLLPPDLQQEISIINIAFNPIASSLLVKGLNRVMCLDGGGGGGLVSREALNTLAITSGGDIRSAMNALQFASKKDTYSLEELFKGSQKPAKKSIRRTKSGNAAASEKQKTGSSVDNKETEAAIGGKDASLFLFRALGKVLYCKRDREKGITEPLPPPLQVHERPPLLENPEAIHDKTSMTAASFGLFLHQNYLNFFSDMESVAEALTHLTHSDVMMAEWTGREVLEQYSASVAVRGLMHANYDSSGGGGGGGWRPFSRPQWYNVARDSQNNTEALKSQYRTHTLTSEELTTVMVPLTAKIYPGNCSMTHKIGLLAEVLARSRSERLDEQDTAAPEEEDEYGGVLGGRGTKSTKPPDVFTSPSSLPTHQHTYHGTIIEPQQEEDDPEEDFRIEDSDDE